MSSPGNSTGSVMWAPVVAFSCILAMMGILLSLPFLLTRARRVPAINRALDKLACLMGAPWPPVDEHPPQHVRKPLSRTALNNLAVSHYKVSTGTTVSAAAATIDFEAQSEAADSCPICFCEYSEGQALITLPCKHFFHKECISRWLKRDATCPMCKHDLQETAEQHSSGSSAASTAASSSSDGGSSSTSSSGAAQATGAVAAAQPAAAAVVAGAPVATGSPAAAAAAGVQTAASSAVADARCIVVEAAQPARQDAGSSAPAALQAVVVAVQ